MGTGCDALEGEPIRFIGYILSNKNLRHKIVDKDSFVDIAKKVLKSDKNLTNLVQGIEKSGDDLGDCLKPAYENPMIQSLVERNEKYKKKDLRTRVKNQHPDYKRGKITKEVERRYKISIAMIKKKITFIQEKQVTIDEGRKTVSVPHDYTRDGQTVSHYKKSEYRKLTRAEDMLIRNNLNKPPAEVIKMYYESGLSYRTPISIRRHYYRYKKKLV